MKGKNNKSTQEVLLPYTYMAATASNHITTILSSSPPMMTLSLTPVTASEISPILHNEITVKRTVGSNSQQVYGETLPAPKMSRSFSWPNIDNEVFIKKTIQKLLERIRNSDLEAIKAIFADLQEIKIFNFSETDYSSIVSIACDLKRTDIVNFLLREIDSLLTSCSKYNPDRTILLINKGIALGRSLPDYEQARILQECCQEALLHNHNDALANFYIGLSLLKMQPNKGNLTKAVTHFSLILTNRQVANVNTHLISAVHLNRGVAYAKQEKYEEAKNDFIEAIRINDLQSKPHQNILAYFNLGIIYLKNKNSSDAVIAFNQAKKLYLAENASQAGLFFENSFNDLINKLTSLDIQKEDVEEILSQDNLTLVDVVNNLTKLVTDLSDKVATHDARLNEIEKMVLFEIENLHAAIDRSFRAQLDISKLSDNRGNTTFQAYKYSLNHQLRASYNQNINNSKTVSCGASILNWGVNIISNIANINNPLARIAFSAPIASFIGLYERHNDKINEMSKQLITLISDKLANHRRGTITSSTDYELLAKHDAVRIMELFYNAKFSKADELDKICTDIVTEIIATDISPPVTSLSNSVIEQESTIVRSNSESMRYSTKRKRKREGGGAAEEEIIISSSQTVATRQVIGHYTNLVVKEEIKVKSEDHMAENNHRVLRSDSKKRHKGDLSLSQKSDSGLTK